MTTNYEALRSKINEMFPERLRLERGCDVAYGKLDDELVPVSEVVYLHADDYSVELLNGKRVHKSEILGILGKPLTIADVLMALAATYQSNWMAKATRDGGIEIVEMRHYNKRNFKNEYIRFPNGSNISAPENAPACAAVLRLLENK